MNYTFYDLTTGRITRVQRAPYEPPPEPGEGRLDDVDISDLTHYVDISSSPAVAVEKSASSAVPDKVSAVADGVDTITISAIPQPSSCVLTGPTDQQVVSFDITDGSLALTFIEPGTVTVEIISVTELPSVITLEAT